MTAPGMSYAALQRWFLEAVAGPHRAAASGPSGPSGPSAPSAHDTPPGPPAPEVSELIRPSRTLDPDARVAIYAGLYFLRLSEALAGTYPAVRRLLGREGFEAMAREYLTRYPSRSYTLNDLGHALPHHLATCAELPMRALLVDVARLESALSQAFDVHDQGTARPEELARIPADRWGDVRLRLDPSMHLLTLEHDALAIVHAVKNDAPLPELAPRRTFAAVWRQHFTVWRKPLPELAHAVLVELGRGATLGAAMETAASRWDGAEAELERDMFQWFSAWLEDGFFCAVTPPRD
jgi:hypothetical protein